MMKLKGHAYFFLISRISFKQMFNSVWCARGKKIIAITIAIAMNKVWNTVLLNPNNHVLLIYLFKYIFIATFRIEMNSTSKSNKYPIYEFETNECVLLGIKL